MKLLDFEIVLAKLLIGMHNSRSRNTLVSHMSRLEVVSQLVFHYTSQFFKLR